MSEPSTISLRLCQDGHANAIALNRENTQLAVAGRSLLKVFSIDQDKFIEVCNMRGGKNQNLSFSSIDVAWSAVDNHILATAATNGVVSVWDLSKFGRQKQLFVYSEHERTTHTVTFHNTEPHLLISGSQDGNIKCFDLRLEKAVHTYFCNSESIRDVKFSPLLCNMFAAVSENGTVQLWDLRRSDKCHIQYTAHSGPIYTCDWHPTKPLLATGSRDKLIKIWNVEQKPVLEHTINTIAVVGKVKWRPDRMYNIASCALVVDYSIYVWDLRRPYLPYVSFYDHTNVVTGICWKGDDPNVLLSASKDSTIFKHSFKDYLRSSRKSNPQGTSLNQNGDLFFSYKLKNLAPTPSVTIPRPPFLNPKSKQPAQHDPFHLAKSTLINYSVKQQSTIKDATKTTLLKDFLTFNGCAKEYILIGKSLSEICDHNAEIAKKYGKANVSLLWTFVKNQYGTTKINQKSESRNSSASQNLLPNRILMSQNSNSKTPIWCGGGEENNDQNMDDKLSQNLFEDIKLHEFKHPKSGEFKNAGGPSFGLTQNGVSHTMTESDSLNNFMYGEAELTVDNMDCVKSLRNGFLYIGPHDLTKCWSFPENSLMGHDLQAAKTHEVTHDNRQDSSPPPDAPSILRIVNPPSAGRWEPHEVLADGLTLQTDVGDVQTSVCILIALGDKRNDLPIDEIVYESWLLAYIELLHRHQLWNEATEIINLSWIRTVCELNQTSTSIHTNCGGCGRTMSSTSRWYCNKCKSAQSSKCSVCNRVVTGLYAWCRGCSHGGHLQHLRQWFSNHSKCPKCGHLCEYE